MTIYNSATDKASESNHSQIFSTIKIIFPLPLFLYWAEKQNVQCLFKILCPSNVLVLLHSLTGNGAQLMKLPFTILS